MSQIEEKLAHLEKTVDDLSDMVAQQDQELSRLRKQVQFLLDREAGREADGAVVLGDERPPHY